MLTGDKTNDFQDLCLKTGLARFYPIKPGKRTKPVTVDVTHPLLYPSGGEGKQKNIHLFLSEYQALLDMLLHLFLITALHFTNEETEAHRNKLTVAQAIDVKARI